MSNIKNKLKAQGLPLNTIVISILVIIVLLVIIVFFVSSVGKSGKTLTEYGAADCLATNPVLSTVDYQGLEVVEGTECQDEKVMVSEVLPLKNEDGDVIAVCCRDN